jgi:hypothetical protein
VESTNSGEAILFTCSKNCFFHGAGLGGAREEVVDMARKRRARRDKGAMVAVVVDSGGQRILGEAQLE